MGPNLHYNVIVAKFVANKSPTTHGCPFMEFRWILVEEFFFINKISSMIMVEKHGA
jgi:hypothetical protein